MQIDTAAQRMARRLYGHVKSELGAGWGLLTPRLRESLVVSQASLTLLGWQANVPLSDAQDLLRAVHALFEES